MTTRQTAEPTAAELAASFGMNRAGARPSLGLYVKQLWSRRQFVLSYTASRNAAGNTGNFLGQAWNVLTPLLNAAVYFLIFGLLLKTNKGVDNFIAFLVVGLFIFQFSSGSLISGSRAITGNIGLLRSLHFPRAVLPIATTLAGLQSLVYSMIVVLPIVLLTGEPVSLHWLELVPAVALQTVFCLGLSLMFARVGAHLPDASQLLPFATRIWMYISGIMYSVDTFSVGHPAWVKTVLEVNPGAVFVNLARRALIDEQFAGVSTWLLALAWAVGIFTVGFLVFWQGEEEYGRV